jgi:hypothetical protein
MTDRGTASADSFVLIVERRLASTIRVGLASGPTSGRRQQQCCATCGSDRKQVSFALDALVAQWLQRLSELPIGMVRENDGTDLAAFGANPLGCHIWRCTRR